MKKNLRKWDKVMIREKTVPTEIVIDLTGPDGNAFNLMAVAHKLGNKLGLDTEVILHEMRDGNYENLIRVFDKFFPFVILER